MMLVLNSAPMRLAAGTSFIFGFPRRISGPDEDRTPLVSIRRQSFPSPEILKMDFGAFFVLRPE
jgi:hypothetical protein